MSRLHSGESVRRTNWVLLSVSGVFLALTGLLLTSTWGVPPPRPPVPLVDPAFLETKASRQSYADLVRAKEDLSDFKCYTCHEKGQPPQLKFDQDHNVIVPEEHENIVMGHGTHKRNNHCFNCHNEANRETLHIRDGRDLPFTESSQLCGSCHGPTMRDWDAGVHGRISGHWDRSLGAFHRLDCVNCHDPHSPRIPSRAPAPAPRPLHPEGAAPTPH